MAGILNTPHVLKILMVSEVSVIKCYCWIKTQIILSHL